MVSKFIRLSKYSLSLNTFYTYKFYLLEPDYEIMRMGQTIFLVSTSYPRVKIKLKIYIDVLYKYFYLYLIIFVTTRINKCSCTNICG